MFERDWLCWVTLMLVARLPKPKSLGLCNLSSDCIMTLRHFWDSWDWEPRARFPLLSPCVRMQHCLFDWPAQWLVVVFLLLLLVSHYDVPQQGLLGELILIQQQIQRHEEEVRRAAAANNARPPPPEPAPSPPPNPSPPQQKRKVKVPSHLDSPYPTDASREEIEFILQLIQFYRMKNNWTSCWKAVTSPVKVSILGAICKHTQHFILWHTIVVQ